MSAQLGLSIAGGLIGGYFGGPIGFSLGSMAGSILGGVFFGESGPTSKGPRLADTRVQVSTYGVMVPIVHGAVRIAGNVIAMPEKGIVERPLGTLLTMLNKPGLVADSKGGVGPEQFNNSAREDRDCEPPG